MLCIELLRGCWLVGTACLTVCLLTADTLTCCRMPKAGEDRGPRYSMAYFNQVRGASTCC